LISHGAERNDLNVSWKRAITGGYGNFKRATGQVQQTKIGFKGSGAEEQEGSSGEPPPLSGAGVVVCLMG
jgi:hypothetical protein